MNREILFRGKRVDNGEWVYGYLVKRPSACYIGVHNPWSIIVPPNDPDDRGGEYWIDPETIGQYTGLTDKNGVKIFEGDILKWDEKEWGCPFFETVTWNYERFGIRHREWKNFCEVIGNIFDNPELLGENNT